MADEKISDMTPLSPVIGTDEVAIIRHGSTVSFQASITTIAAFVGTNIPISPNITATGTNQAGAYLLSSATTIFDTVTSGAGAILPTWGTNAHYKVINRGANSLLLYPATGAQIETLGANNPGTITAGSAADAWADTSNLWRVT